ncbi:MAG: GDP-mannose 4,6-dehydratase, partial [Acidobacteriota bacterium]
VREFLELAAEYSGVDWKKYVEIDARYLRPTEVDHLQGDSSKAREMLGWKPEMTFEALARGWSTTTPNSPFRNRLS